MNNDVSYTIEPENNEPATKKSSLGLISMIIGIVNVVCCCCGNCIPYVSYVVPFVVLILGVVSLVLAIVSKKQAGKMDGFAIAGMILGILGIVMGVVAIVTFILGLVLGVGTSFLSMFAESSYY